MALQRMVNGVLVDLTPDEEAAKLAGWAAVDAQKIVDDRQEKRDKLIAYEKEKAIDILIATEKENINALDDAGLDTAISLLPNR